MMPSELPQDQGQVSEDEGVAMESHKQTLVDGLDKCTTTLEEDAEIDISEIGEEYQHDPTCDPDNPIQVKFQDVSAAAYKIKSGVFRSPCSKSNLSTMVGMDLYLKKDYLQTTGSFKERGARNTLLMLPEEYKQRGVIAASAGNHALAMAYHGKLLGIPIFVVMPKIAPIMKVNRCKQHGATILIKGEDIGESKKLAMYLAKKRGYFYVNGYDNPHIISGQGTMGLEILEQVPDVDAVVCPVGGAGLIAGLALAIKSLNPSVQIIGVESDQTKSFSAALEAGRPTYFKVGPTLADGLAVPVVGVNSFATCHHLIDKMVTVAEDTIALAILRLIEVEKAVVEGAGATGLAAILSGQLPELAGKRVVVPMCGGNIDTTVLGRVLERGLATDSRLVRFIVTVSDRPGGIAELTQILLKLGVSIKDIFHERAFLKSAIFQVQVKCIVETTGQAHAERLHTLLKENYSNVIWGPEDM
ncbi:L-threonine dehydratase catabolic TdcB-like [Lytechinus variegatus]|uniref:L-threonine dehydratase catabolic TdcB-like n=1 Tax=Lytechinus variegatus TaxID=7654 RepID=UPI001BB1E8B3|nr:L-threonine dehydratase catabolic TdcB-like [Lytechinus variegatus]